MDRKEQAIKAMEDFLEAFYREDEEGRAGTILGEFFWCKSEIFELVVDAYERTDRDEYRILMRHMYDGFVADEGEEWSHNPYNDDIMWMTIGCVRAFLLTGEREYFRQAEHHFDVVYKRGYNQELGGGIFWRIENQCKNACINGPAAIAACLLAKACQKMGQKKAAEAYLEKAISIYEWERKTLFEENGGVMDNISIEGVKDPTYHTYNQGTFIGAAVFLYQATEEEQYLKDAVLAADFTRDVMYQGGVPGAEESEGGDRPGFKGILCRWLGKLVRDCGQTQYLPWMNKMADTVWENRNSQGLMWTDWSSKTEDGKDYTAWGCSAAVALLFSLL